MSPRTSMILCLVCLAAVGMFLVAGCTSTPPAGNATPTRAPNATTAPTMNNTILKINNNQAPNLSANATAVATTAPAATGGNKILPNITLPSVNVSNLTNVTLPNINLTR